MKISALAAEPASKNARGRKSPLNSIWGLGKRPAIYFPFAQAVPRVPVIDVANCAYFKTGKCRACEKFCPRQAIDFDQQEQRVEIEVGAIFLATGFHDFDPQRSPQYGYGDLDNVLTSMEFERLINSGGPTTGKVLLKDGRKPEKIAILHCVGSRGDQHEYCSRVCCMYSLKLAQLARDYVDAEVVEFYRDMRTFGKDYEAFYERVVGMGWISSASTRISVSQRQDGTAGGRQYRCVHRQADSKPGGYGGIEHRHGAQSDAPEVARTFGISLSPDGFFLEKHPKLAPVETTTDGVYLAGACQSPKDIPDSVAQGGAAAAAASR